MEELPKERLATTDEGGNRVYLYPSSVFGKYNTLREKTRYVLIAIFLLIPWLKIGGKQAIFLNVAERRFNFFGYVLWAHDAPMVFFVFGTFALTIAFITAVWGRFWCGWACPQTVFVEGVYRKIENLIEGSPAARRVLDRGPWNGEKIFKKSLKYFSFLLVSLIITHSFLAYFVGSSELAKMIASPPSENLTSFLVILFSTAIIFFDFAWFKEQFCVIACPYGRLQSVLMDDNSLIVAYDEKRGEPRLKKGLAGVKFGDCVSCNRCVQACPTGIDIRRGLQMECIACTACIDACSEVMTKNNRPTGLIRYTTRNELIGLGTKKIHARTKIYLGMIFVFLSIFIFVLSRHERLQLTFLRAKDIPYQMIEQNGVKIAINHFKVEIANQRDTDSEIVFSLSETDKALGYKLAMQLLSYNLKGGENRKIDFFIEVPVKNLELGHANLKIYYQDHLQKVRSEDLRVVGPFN